MMSIHDAVEKDTAFEPIRLGENVLFRCFEK